MERIYSKDELWKTISYGFLFSLLCTVDEQVFGVCIILTGFSLLNSFFEKKANINIWIFGSSILFYALFYHTWGRWLCQYFTPATLKAHYHNFEKLIDFAPFVKDGFRMYYEALVRLTFDNESILIIFFLMWIVCLVFTRNIKVAMCSIYLWASGFVFSLMLVTAHPTIATLEEQSKGFYYNICVWWAITAFIYVMAHIESKKFQYLKMAFLVLPILNLLIVHTNLEKYELTHATEGGVFLDVRKRLKGCFETPGAQQMGLQYRYFDGLLISDDDYKLYIKDRKRPH